MRLIISESEKNRIKRLYLNEQDRNPSNADAHPDLDELGFDDYWDFPKWQTWFNSNVSKYGKKEARKKFISQWAPAEEGFEDGETEGIGEGEFIDWLKSNGLWNNETGYIYTIDEFSNLKDELPKNKMESKEFYPERIKPIYDSLRRAGFDDKESAALLGNIYYETTYDPSSLNPDDDGAPSFGIIQWRGGYPGKVDVKLGSNNKLSPLPKCDNAEKYSRLKKFLCVASDIYNLDQQTDFLRKEATQRDYSSDGWEKSNWDKVIQNKDISAKDMGILIDQKFIRSDHSTQSKRGQLSQKIYNDIIKGYYA